MLLSLSKNSTAKDPLLFDIRLNNTDHDVLLVKGQADEANAVLLTGTIVLSVLEPIQIKNLNLRLFGKLRLDIPTTYKANGVVTKRYTKYEKRLFTHRWDPFDIDDYFDHLYDNYDKKKLISNKSATNLNGLQRKSKSSTSLLSLGSSSGSNSHTLVKGNYEFPFSAILPGSITESVEGLPHASVTYQLEATIERPRMGDLICRKPLRIVRTLSPDVVELSETVSVENTWPKKVDYSISIPAKAVAVGSATPIYIMLVPLLKGLRMGSVKITLVESSQYLGNVGNVTLQERVVTKMKVKDPLGHVAQMSNKNAIGDGSGEREEVFDFQDRWEIETILNVPPSLSKCTQDCNVTSHIKVRHKLKFVITLINSDGHASELRAALPVQLFISPFVTVGVKSTATLEKERGVQHWSPINHQDVSVSSEQIAHEGDGDDDDILFANASSEIELHAGSLENNFLSPTAISELMTPPNYEQHIYDRLWGDINSQSESASGSMTPLNSMLQTHTVVDDHAMDHLNHSLEEFNLMRESSSTPVYVPAQTNPFRDAQFPSFAVSDPDNHISADILESPAFTPGFDHISRTNSFINLHAPSPLPMKKVLEAAELNRLPPYQRAVKSDIIVDDLPPSYPTENATHECPSQQLGEPKGPVLEKPPSVRHRSSSFLTLPRNQRSQASLSRSNNSSTNSLNLLTNNSTGGSLTVPEPSCSSNAPLHKVFNPSKKLSFTMTPVMSSSKTTEGTSPSSSSRKTSQSSSSTSVHQQSASFPAFIDLFSKK
ncbi:arrestin family protein KNAG_0I01660 [Huiozyma naganishii CBS 8797]|uniref:Arrestin C-terminal-like domain-containing protein n=1 Tax=Huiozyma naganishii (strain ATCC MYA-139 / BCRC 22969 / CBS 8797 / KCTC 17520 / NBRC 10181 / NCYC 3082 / Yp74L-3) TaxID=1071383 RepID=J7SA70_HUIN7|nr:hypothetical protein KNAG_0I01660 [Kazachstania naganishii CBS 8797]CCK71951.1 hypothetical protein KNAG_0I01660 [Kazachstania naganishii CBS 8797]